MIRRDDRGDWLIIEQIDHARLAVELARVWAPGNLQNASRADLKKFDGYLSMKGHELPKRHAAALRDLYQKWGASFPAELALWLAVTLHDQGWKVWDKAPRIDPATGIPRSFLEMRMSDATAIWAESIAICSDAPIAGFAVSRHFCFLAEQVREGGRHDSEDHEAVERFLRQQDSVQETLIQTAWSNRRGEEFERYRELGYRTVQFFDRVSLWLCCGERHDAEQLTGPNGEHVTFIPRPAEIAHDSSSSVFRMRISRPDYRSWNTAIDPYPLSVESLELNTPAKRIPARCYADDADLQATLNEAVTVQLSWKIGPA